MAKKAKTESNHFWKYVKRKVKTQSNVTNLEKMDSSLYKSDKEKQKYSMTIFLVFLHMKIVTESQNLQKKNLNRH